MIECTRTRGNGACRAVRAEGLYVGKDKTASIVASMVVSAELPESDVPLPNSGDHSMRDQFNRSANVAIDYDVVHIRDDGVCAGLTLSHGRVVCDFI